MLNLANGLGPEFDEAIAERFPSVHLTVVDQHEPWNIPAGTEVAFIRPGPGWRGSPSQMPNTWTSVKWVQAISAGVDFYPKWVLNAPNVTRGKGLTAEPIAEYVLCAMLNHEKSFAEMRVRRPEDWVAPTMGSLNGKTLGLVGYGALGQPIARLALAFGMKVCVLNRSGGSSDTGIQFVRDIGAMISEVDHLVLAAPLTSETRGMINADVLKQARRGLHLVNIARGAMIEMDALIKALDSGLVSRATLDVTNVEPPEPGNIVYSHPQIFLTPHCCWRGGSDLSTREIEQMLGNLERYIGGKPLDNRIDLARGY